MTTEPANTSTTDVTDLILARVWKQRGVRFSTAV